MYSRRRVYGDELAVAHWNEATRKFAIGRHECDERRHLLNMRRRVICKRNFVQALKGDDLADRAHMSPSTFRQHFRALTGVSPLQYQKQLRLQKRGN